MALGLAMTLGPFTGQIRRGRNSTRNVHARSNQVEWSEEGGCLKGSWWDASIAKWCKDAFSYRKGLSNDGWHHGAQAPAVG